MTVLDVLLILVAIIAGAVASVSGFGVTSAAGGLAGALMYGYLQSAVLTGVFAALLIFAGVAGGQNATFA